MQFYRNNGVYIRYALVRGVSESFQQSLKQKAPEIPIDLTLAKAQHYSYVTELKKVISTVIEIPSDDRYPDCCFIEDTSVVIENTALICRLGAPSRRGEEEALCHMFKELGLKQIKMSAPATLDGGDVLFTGSEIFVGHSQRTNPLGIQTLEHTFPDYPVFSIPVPEGLHLKSAITQIDDDLFAVANTPGANAMFCEMAKICPGYRPLWIPDPPAANCLRVGDTLFHLNGYPQSIQVFSSLNLKPIALQMTELEKADGGLTCLSILIRRR